MDQQGNILGADRGNERLQVLGPDGRFIAKFRGESGWDAANLEPELDPAYSDPLKYESGSIIKLF